MLTDAGWVEWFVHGMSHGVGLDIHEDPFASAASDDVLLGNDVVTVEPGLYRGDFGGVRIEDLVVVGDDGPLVLPAPRSPPERGAHPRRLKDRHARHHDQRPQDGHHVELDNGLFQVIEFQHVKPGKGAAFVRTKLRNLRSGNVFFDRTFNAGVRVEQAILEKRDMEFLYKDGEDFVFMDTDTYDEMTVAPWRSATPLPTWSNRLSRSSRHVQRGHRQRRDPGFGRSRRRDTEPGVQGDRVSGARKAATLQTGKAVQVPLFVNVGDKIKVDTRSGPRLHHACRWPAAAGPSTTHAPTPASGPCSCCTRETKGISPRRCRCPGDPPRRAHGDARHRCRRAHRRPRPR